MKTDDNPVVALMPAAKSIAVTLWWTLPIHVELDDLIAEANAHLVEAWAKYNPERGPFENWARFKVRRGLSQYLRDADILTRSDRKRVGNGFCVEQQFADEDAPAGTKLSRIVSREISPHTAAMASELLGRFFDSRKVRVTPPTPPPKPIGVLETMDQAKRRHALEVVEACGNNRSRAAGILGISRSQLWELLKSGNAANERTNAAAQ